MTQKITPFLWFDGKAEEAMNFYVSIFENAKILNVSRYGDEGPGDAGTVMSATFELDGEQFIALNGGPEFTFSPAISFFVRCETQAEVDRFWEQLSEGGSTNRCGWLTDKYGFWWNIVPAGLSDYIGGAEPEKAQRAMQAMLKMTKLDINELRRAYDGKEEAASR